MTSIYCNIFLFQGYKAIKYHIQYSINTSIKGALLLEGQRHATVFIQSAPCPLSHPTNDEKMTQRSVKNHVKRQYMYVKRRRNKFSFIKKKKRCRNHILSLRTAERNLSSLFLFAMTVKSRFANSDWNLFQKLKYITTWISQFPLLFIQC